MTAPWTTALAHHAACEQVVAWARQHPDLPTAWEVCTRPDWLLWLLAQQSGPRGSEAHRALVLTACACARTALRHVPPHETHPQRALETAEQWARGEKGITLADVHVAAAAALTAATHAAAAIAAAAYAATAVTALAYAVGAGHAADAAARTPADVDLCALIRARHPHAPPLEGRRTSP